MSELQKYFALEIAYNGRAIQTSVYVYVAEEVDAARATDKATIAELQERLARSEAALRRIDSLNDNPACFNGDIQEILDAALAADSKPDGGEA